MMEDVRELGKAKDEEERVAAAVGEWRRRRRTGCSGDGGRNKGSVAEEEALAGVAENGETDGEKGGSGGGQWCSAREAGWRTPGGGDSDGSKETEKKRGRVGEGGGHGGRGSGLGSSDKREGSSDGAIRPRRKERERSAPVDDEGREKRERARVVAVMR